MKQLFLLLICNAFFIGIASAQNYDNIVNYHINGSPTYGVKIKTNLPFVPDKGMPTITITGYSYGTQETINLTLVTYVWFDAPYIDPSTAYFYNPAVSSAGSYTPPIYLSNEGGKIVIYINDRVYFQRFTVSAYAQGNQELPEYFQGWTAVDEPLVGTKSVLVPYKNKFSGTLTMPGTGIWQSDGNVGIGTINPKERLSVNGNMRAHEIKVEVANWPDYVFDNEYKLPSLQETGEYIKANKHLPGIPAAVEVKENGISLGAMNSALLKKIEELTLYLIEKEAQLKNQQDVNVNMENRLSILEHHLKIKSN